MGGGEAPLLAPFASVSGCFTLPVLLSPGYEIFSGLPEEGARRPMPRLSRRALHRFPPASHLADLETLRKNTLRHFSTSSLRVSASSDTRIEFVKGTILFLPLFDFSLTYTLYLQFRRLDSRQLARAIFGSFDGHSSTYFPLVEFS